MQGQWDSVGREEIEIAVERTGKPKGFFVAFGFTKPAWAAEAAGLSKSTLRSWFRQGLIESKLAKGQYGQQRLVKLSEVVERTRRSPRLSGRAADSRPGEIAALPPTNTGPPEA